jgi:hypothetical protein
MVLQFLFLIFFFPLKEDFFQHDRDYGNQKKLLFLRSISFSAAPHDPSSMRAPRLPGPVLPLSCPSPRTAVRYIGPLPSSATTGARSQLRHSQTGRHSIADKPLSSLLPTPCHSLLALVHPLFFPTRLHLSTSKQAYWTEFESSAFRFGIAPPHHFFLSIESLVS